MNRPTFPLFPLALLSLACVLGPSCVASLDSGGEPSEAIATAPEALNARAGLLVDVCVPPGEPVGDAAVCETFCYCQKRTAGGSAFICLPYSAAFGEGVPGKGLWMYDCSPGYHVDACVSVGPGHSDWYTAPNGATGPNCVP